MEGHVNMLKHHEIKLDISQKYAPAISSLPCKEQQELDIQQLHQKMWLTWKQQNQMAAEQN